ncbi:uncharacterized protein C2845_PM02G25040 [Panicum miliaceum]|uniref:Uncharacterized protein n=1 Tax=Panicum miliaceum TaxID=4540 RepID=A0A3L6SF13_PANMI|nr:uncharacterized protein C2845_PM02G25040 [Panicum miliaceum]
MGLPLEQWRGGEADGKDAPAPAGCRTPGRAQEEEGPPRGSSRSSGAGTTTPAPTSRPSSPPTTSRDLRRARGLSISNKKSFSFKKKNEGSIRCQEPVFEL